MGYTSGHMKHVLVPLILSLVLQSTLIGAEPIKKSLPVETTRLFITVRAYKGVMPLGNPQQITATLDRSSVFATNRWVEFHARFDSATSSWTVPMAPLDARLVAPLLFEARKLGAERVEISAHHLPPQVSIQDEQKMLAARMQVRTDDVNRRMMRLGSAIHTLKFLERGGAVGTVEPSLVTELLESAAKHLDPRPVARSIAAGMVATHKRSEAMRRGGCIGPECMLTPAAASVLESGEAVSTGMNTVVNGLSSGDLETMARGGLMAIIGASGLMPVTMIRAGTRAGPMKPVTVVATSRTRRVTGPRTPTHIYTNSVLDSDDIEVINLANIPGAERSGMEALATDAYKRGTTTIDVDLAKQASETIRKHPRAAEIQRVIQHIHTVYLDFGSSEFLAAGWNKRAYVVTTRAGKRVVYRPFPSLAAHQMWAYERQALDDLDLLGIPRIERRYHATDMVADSPLLKGYAPIRQHSLETDNFTALMDATGNSRTVESLRDIAQKLRSRGAEVEDLHLGMDADGSIMIVDPLAVIAAETPIQSQILMDLAEDVSIMILRRHGVKP
jgi:hypothetical protein